MSTCTRGRCTRADWRLKSISISVKTREVPEILPYLQESKLVCYHFMDAGREHKTPRQTHTHTDTHTRYYSKSSSQSVSNLHCSPSANPQGDNKGQMTPAYVVGGVAAEEFRAEGPVDCEQAENTVTSKESVFLPQLPPWKLWSNSSTFTYLVAYVTRYRAAWEKDRPCTPSRYVQDAQGHDSPDSIIFSWPYTGKCMWSNQNYWDEMKPLKLLLQRTGILLPTPPLPQRRI